MQWLEDFADLIAAEDANANVPKLLYIDAVLPETTGTTLLGGVQYGYARLPKVHTGSQQVDHVLALSQTPGLPAMCDTNRNSYKLLKQ